MDWDFNTTNETFDTEVIHFVQYPLSTRILGGFVSLFSTTSNLIIILTICKFPKLHSRIYWYIVNWCICNVFITASMPYIYNIFDFETLVIDKKLFCIWQENSFNFLTGNQFFVAVIILDWYINTFANQRSCSLRCRNNYKTIILAVWIFLMILILITTFLCIFDNSSPLSVLCYGFSYLGIFFLFCIISLLRCFKLKRSSIVVEKSKLEFRLAFSYFISWLFTTLYLFNIKAFHKYFSPTTNYMILELTTLLGLSHAIVLLIILYVLDRSFRICVRTMFNLPIGDSDIEFKVKQDLLDIL
ncbi:chemokine XC receptor 1-like [Diorhabda carinulata]|uniref:chemokine XC receptor 1-like n=1 Tax=Diorhabda carinulata TaxID=1163345 RepID=UPI0025A2535C|nr:chemokine XC receptor 1-like [Diorhabda carinulata]